MPLFPPCLGSRKEWLVGLKEFGRYVHGLSGVGGRERMNLFTWEKALRSFDLEAWAGAQASWTIS